MSTSNEDLNLPADELAALKNGPLRAAIAVLVIPSLTVFLTPAQAAPRAVEYADALIAELAQVRSA
jgi:hypothetical protein